MIVTRGWLEEFIKLDDVTDEQLYMIFNRIGLEVDSIHKHDFDKNVVVGRVLHCQKHPNADKLNLCSVDVGEDEPLQIVCGASNVVNAEYVAVAKVGATLPGDFHIKPAKLRGVDSFGMICSAKEIGLPDIGKGIMILDDSIGELIVGKPLREYSDLADTVIELELTANRGDCLSIRGVARDLSASLNRELKRHEHQKKKYQQTGIGRELEVHTQGDIPVKLLYTLLKLKEAEVPFIMALRLGFVGKESNNGIISASIDYSIHATGVILRAYDVARLKDSNGKISINILQESKGVVKVFCDNKELSCVGVYQNSEYMVDHDITDVLVEASYIDPELLVDAVSKNRLKTDSLYYNSSRGSEPELNIGIEYFESSCDCAGECRFANAPLSVENRVEPKIISVETEHLNSIIGKEVSRSTIHTILKRLGFGINRSGTPGRFGAVVPSWRHDISNIYDIAEEILRIVGIDNIEPKPLELIEKNRLNDTTKAYRAKRDIRQRAVSAGFYEAITYAFSDRKKQSRYGYGETDANVELINPIVEELNTMRRTLLINLLDSVSRNISYGKKRVPLFEIGMVFDKERNESEKIAFVWSGDAKDAQVSNQGKPKKIDFVEFIEKIGNVIGDFELRNWNPGNELLHPYQSAKIYKDGKEIGFCGKLHPKAQEDFDIDTTMVCEISLESIMPKHNIASSISNYQGVYKDLSLLIDKETEYSDIRAVLKDANIPLLKKFFPIDIYSDDSLGDKMSLTLRFYLLSEKSTLSDKQIEQSMSDILKLLQDRVGAILR